MSNFIDVHAWSVYGECIVTRSFVSAGLVREQAMT